MNGKTKFVVKKGDITKEVVDAIVNAANLSLMGGGGVDGAIHLAGGGKILEECKKIREIKGPCRTGNAVITTGGTLPAKCVIHTVGPVWHGGTSNEEKLLKNCYINSLKLAKENNIKTIAFPSISTGIYGYPIEKAALVAIGAVKEFCTTDQSINEVRFILFSDYDFTIYQKQIDTLNK